MSKRLRRSGRRMLAVSALAFALVMAGAPSFIRPYAADAKQWRRLPEQAPSCRPVFVYNAQGQFVRINCP